jgi:hypothetical protein
MHRSADRQDGPDGVLAQWHDPCAVATQAAVCADGTSGNTMNDGFSDSMLDAARKALIGEPEPENVEIVVVDYDSEWPRQARFC